MTATVAIVKNAIAITIDSYLYETLQRDLVAHSRSAAAFLVYFQIYCLSKETGRNTVTISHSVLAESIGISKRSVQTAVGHLIARKLLRSHKARATSVPVYTVLTPWVRRGKGTEN